MGEDCHEGVHNSCFPARLVPHPIPAHPAPAPPPTGSCPRHRSQKNGPSPMCSSHSHLSGKMPTLPSAPRQAHSEAGTGAGHWLGQAQHRGGLSRGLTGGGGWVPPSWAETPPSLCLLLAQLIPPASRPPIHGGHTFRPPGSGQQATRLATSLP